MKRKRIILPRGGSTGIATEARQRAVDPAGGERLPFERIAALFMSMGWTWGEVGGRAAPPTARRVEQMLGRHIGACAGEEDGFIASSGRLAAIRCEGKTVALLEFGTFPDQSSTEIALSLVEVLAEGLWDHLPIGELGYRQALRYVRDLLNTRVTSDTGGIARIGDLYALDCGDSGVTLSIAIPPSA